MAGGTPGREELLWQCDGNRDWCGRGVDKPTWPEGLGRAQVRDLAGRESAEIGTLGGGSQAMVARPWPAGERRKTADKAREVGSSQGERFAEDCERSETGSQRSHGRLTW